MNKKRLYKLTKSLFANSKTDGFVDEKKVKNILNLLNKTKPANLVSTLRIYKRLIKSSISKEQIVVESALKVQDKRLQQELLSKTKARRIIYKANPKIVFGAKITHGDWIWDATLDSKLKQLTSNSSIDSG